MVDELLRLRSEEEEQLPRHLSKPFIQDYKRFLSGLDVWDFNIFRMFLENGGMVFGILVKDLRGLGCKLHPEALRDRLYRFEQRGFIERIPRTNPTIMEVRVEAEQLIKKIMHDWLVLSGLESVSSQTNSKLSVRTCK